NETGAYQPVRSSYGGDNEPVTPEVVEAMLKKGAILNARTVEGMTALDFAQNQRHSKNILLLLKHGAEVPVGSPTELGFRMQAAQSGDIALMEQLAARGSDIDFKDSFERTPLMYATQQNQLAMVRWLLDHHADIN